MLDLCCLGLNFFFLISDLHLYHLSTKLREVFSRVCLSGDQQGIYRGSNVTITHNALDLTVQRLYPSRPQSLGCWTSLYRDANGPTPHCKGMVLPWYCPSPPCIGPHCTRTQASPPGHVRTCSTWTSLYRNPLLVTSGGQDWKPVQTCSPEDPPDADFWWLMKHAYSRQAVVRILLECFLVQVSKFAGDDTCSE